MSWIDSGEMVGASKTSAMKNGGYKNGQGIDVEDVLRL